MGLSQAGLLLWMLCSAFSSQVRSGGHHGSILQNPAAEWVRMQAEIRNGAVPAYAPIGRNWGRAATGQLATPAPKFPRYMVISAGTDQKEDFKPGQGAGGLPSSDTGVVLGSASYTLETERIRDPNMLVQVLCHVDRMYVRIKREVFKTIDAYKYLKVGKCVVNAATSIHYYFLYLLKTDCGFQQESKADFVYISNVLSYEPTTPVLREMPFNIPLLCKYPRYFLSYETGFHPMLQGGTVFKPLYLKGSLTLTPQDVMGNPIIGSKTYSMGELMYFEAKQPENKGRSGGQRIYINMCYVTASPNPNSSPKYAVIDNQGCMTDSKVTKTSMFLTGASMTALKFCVAAFLFKDAVSTSSSSSSQKLYMHCEIAMGPLVATSGSKACNYDPATAKWKELYDDSSVCTCCDSTCPLGQARASRRMISSHSWNVGLSDKDENAGLNPGMSPIEAVALEDPYSSQHKDFLAYWEHNYQK